MPLDGCWPARIDQDTSVEHLAAAAANFSIGLVRPLMARRLEVCCWEAIQGQHEMFPSAAHEMVL